MTFTASGLSGFVTVALSPGSSDSQNVLALQNWLVKNGLLTQTQLNSGPGSYGPATTAAVTALQQQLGIDAGSSPGYYGVRTISTIQAEIDALTPNFTANPDQIGIILIEQFEGFRSTAYLDSDGAYRVGYGDQYYAVSNGSGGWIYNNAVTKNTTGVTTAAAAAQLQHSIDTDYIGRVENAIGTSTFLSLSPLRQAVLESLAYNYGHVPSTIVTDFANHSSFQQIANDIQALTANADRRASEASLFRWEPPGGSTNHAPVANADSYSTSKNTALTVAASGVLSNDSDADFNSLTVSSYTNPSHGTLSIFSNGSFTYTPASGYTGTDSFTYWANDGTVNSASPATVTITINAPADRSPVVSLPSGANVTATTNGQVFGVASLFSASDPDNDTLSYYLLDSTSGTNSGHWQIPGVTNVEGSWSGPLTASQLAQTTFKAGLSGTDDISLLAYDGQLYDSKTVHVTAHTDQSPLVSLPSGANVTASRGQVFSVSSLFSASDPENDTLSYYLLDSTAGANTGHWQIPGITNVEGTWSGPLTASQLAQTTFKAGLGGTDDISLLAYDGQLWDSKVVHVTAPTNHTPVVSLPSGANVTASSKGQVFSASSLFSASDPDNDTLSYYLLDNTVGASTGHWQIPGVTNVEGVWSGPLTASQLAQTTFKTALSGADDISLLAYDGSLYDTKTVHISAPANQTPVVSLPSGANVTATTNGQVFSAASLFSASDPDNDTLSYYLLDSTAGANTGHWQIPGVTNVEGTWSGPLTASQLAQTTFKAGLSGTDDISLLAYDGQLWDSKTVHVTAHVDQTPVVSLPSGANVTAATNGQVFSAASLFSASDPDNDTLSYYLLDSTAGANTGHWQIPGVTNVEGVWSGPLTASQLAQTTFKAGLSGTDDISLLAYDGQLWDSKTVHVTAHTDQSPVVGLPSGANVTAATNGQVFSAASLFSASDPDNDTLSYYLLDSTAGVNTGHWQIPGVTNVEGTWSGPLTASQLAQTTFKAGLSGTDDISLLAYDGQLWDSKTVHVTAHADQTPVVSLPSGPNVTAATNGQVFSAASLFSASDPDNDTLSYYLLDNTAGANTGHWQIPGVTNVEGVWSGPLTAAQVAQTTFKAGLSGTDDISLLAYDGQLWDSKTVHVTAHIDQTPVVSLPAGANVTATSGQVFSAASLFNASDPDNDTLSYYLLDNTAGANTGHWQIPGTINVKGVWSGPLTGAQLAQTTFKAGVSGTDDISLLAYDGQLWDSKTVHVAAPAIVGAQPDENAWLLH